jgi:hypothetical protein
MYASGQKIVITLSNPFRLADKVLQLLSENKEKLQYG